MKKSTGILAEWLIASWMLFCFGSLSLAAEPRRITFGYSSIGPMMHGLWMAKETGAFEKYGLEAELIFIPTGPVVIQALLGGDLHAGVAATSALINAVLQGAPLVAVGVTANRPYHRLWVQPEINRMEDLRGKTLGITRIGSYPHQLTVILLRKYGLEGAVNLRQYGDTRGLAVAFQQQAIAGTVTSSLNVGPQTSIKILVNLADLGIAYINNVIAVARDFHRRSPKAVEGIVRAYIEGVAALKRDKNKALKVIAKYSHSNDSAFLENGYADSSTYLDQVPRVDKAGVSTILQVMGKKDAPLETFADNSIVDRLVNEGFIDKLYTRP
ncbi:MAG: ABC transporter substrate-binding protein [Deltaproteobacteria bacterium]|nr:ABC transporter substrate-binding protein [Deltaproteobacteria bacterium]